MTTYTSISNALVAVGAKPFASTIQALRDNTLAIGEGDATVPITLLPTVLLGTITTTSGVTQTLSGLVLTPYKSLALVIDGVSANGTHSLTFLSSAITVGAALDNAVRVWNGKIDVDLGTGLGRSWVSMGSAVSAPAALPATTLAYFESGLSTASTSVSFTVVGGGTPTFDAGSINVYGCK